MTVGVSLMKNVLTFLAKCIFLNVFKMYLTASATNAAIQKKIFGSGMTANFKQRNERCHKNS